MGIPKYLEAHMEMQYENETDAMYRERVKRMREYNDKAEAILQAWAPSPMKGYEKWCRAHAPELLEPGGLERLRNEA